MAEKAKILLVDDDFISLRILKTTLDNGRFDIFTADNARQALTILRNQSADILITDIRMPGMDGLELIQEAQKELCDLICIVVSASDDITLCIEAMKLGAINYILKPINFHELNHTVNNAIEKYHLIESIKNKQHELEVKNQQLLKEIEIKEKLYRDLKSSDQHLQQSQEQLQLAVDGAELGIWNLDLNDMTFTLNEKWNNLLERTFNKDCVEYETIRDLVHPEDKMFSYDDFSQIDNDEHNFYERQLRVRTGSGKWKWVLTRGKVVEWDNHGNPVRAAGTIQNYSFVKNIEDALLETQYRLNTILNNMHEIIFYMDINKKILWVNKTACEVAEKSEAEIINQCCHNILFDHTSTCKTCPVDANPDNEKWENIVTKKNRIYHMHIYPIKNSNNEVSAYIEVGLDITEQEKAKEEAKLRAEQLFQADKMVSLGILVSGVAHEINNPNNYMMLNIALIKQAWDDLTPTLEASNSYHSITAAEMEWHELKKEIPVLMNGIEEGTERVKEIVRELKDYARDIPVDMTSEVRIDDVIHAALVLCESLIKRSTKNFNYNCEKYIPVFKGDPQRIEQVIINIIQNACQALEDREKGIVINTFHDILNNAVIIEVIDEGRGIPNNHLKHIKDPFFTTKRESGGTGLGVSISNTIITEHGGHLAYQSQDNNGTKVTVTLPIRS